MIKGFDQYINESLDGSSCAYPKTAKYARDVIGIVKKSKQYNKSYEEIRELEYKDDNSFDLVVQIKKDDSPNFETDEHFSDIPWEEINFKEYGFAMDANTYINKGDLIIPEIIITLIIDPTKEPNLYKELEFKLIDIIKHELNHTDQVGWNRDPFNTRPSSGADRSSADSSFKYFNLPDEIESMVIGMYERTKAENIELDELFDKYLVPFVLNGNLSKREYDKVFDTWLRHALENYPDAKLNTSDPRVKKIVNSI
jgi:hypothetical protein